MRQILKYPRTQHIEGSKEQWGDEDLNMVPGKELKGKYLVVEEKMDGANCAVSFFDEGQMVLQSRGHELTGGPREKHFNLFKTWANMHIGRLWELLGTRYIMYGEWMYAKHTIYYDALPHYFLEFDIYDRENQAFLSTERRKEMLKNFRFIHSVRILHTGIVNDPDILPGFLGPSYAITQKNRDNLIADVTGLGLNVERVIRETDLDQTMEGLYIKEENSDIVLNRYKYVRGSFLSAVMNSEGHWLNRPIVPNRLINKQVMYEME